MIGRSQLSTIFVALALCLVLASNIVDLRRAHGELEKMRDAQATALADGRKVETQVDALAKGTNALAQSGNANAQRIVATLKQNGVSIK